MVVSSLRVPCSGGGGGGGAVTVIIAALLSACHPSTCASTPSTDRGFDAAKAGGSRHRPTDRPTDRRPERRRTGAEKERHRRGSGRGRWRRWSSTPQRPRGRRASRGGDLHPQRENPDPVYPSLRTLALPVVAILRGIKLWWSVVSRPTPRDITLLFSSFLFFPFFLFFFSGSTKIEEEEESF